MIAGDPAAPPLRAVVIDGSGAELEAAVAQCRQAGIIVNGWSDCAAGGLELIESLPSPPDLVIMELDLPDMDGAGLLQALSMLEPGLPIIITSRHTARLHDAALTLATTLGLEALAALPKPLTADALRNAVDSCPPAAARIAAHRISDTRTRCGTAPPQPGAGEILTGLQNRQFELYYQPKTCLQDGSLRGAEALIRWRHPAHGLLSPACFLPQTEAANLVDVLTVEVLHLALSDWRRWQADGLSLPLSVNLSPLSLTDPHLAEQLIQAVNDANVPPRAITFEIIEHQEIADLATALRILIKLRMQGFGLALDDYGAGHASMLQLSRFPFTELKLDRRLVHGASKRPHMHTLLRHAIASARELGVTTVAEGIEMEQDRQLLRELGCDQAQGYLIARPMPASALPLWREKSAAAGKAGGTVIQLRP
ncbi:MULTISPECIES: EAL domain-containing protein [unclassified Duganella]|uniref:EAL domain-containing response regulator n=1 Tax=unclassified Duganella TaxID=2636909 RepID=UPI0008884D0E|nr:MULTISPECIES: EAL domain-containing response regulator [unclassified Duganella]SDF59844.1 EAL domain, c-di-GMP-specific phosphodiesterase class I (or its enzymatically inactive variant) [Duganella sp. OV458]SDI68855.1 EAL domain, c-di-GMP-specific phosphodiesterase class I (or its enzymatically inactive variant) [Duganella sp. OV510]